MRDVDLERLLNRRIDVIFARGLAEEDVDGEGPAGDRKARRVVVEGRELRGGKKALAAGHDHGTSRKLRALLTLAAFIVADVTISFKSRRRDRTEHGTEESCVSRHDLGAPTWQEARGRLTLPQ